MPQHEEIKTAYEEICRAHDGISEFRAKLLALLPIASGAGIFLLLNQDFSMHLREMRPHLLVIGPFGVLITFGLFLYELRGIQRCNELYHCGGVLEAQFLCDLKPAGPFSSRLPSAFDFVGNTWAALLIYPTVMAGWAYVGCVGLPTWLLPFTLPVVALLGLVFFGFGFLTIRRQEQILQEKVWESLDIDPFLLKVTNLNDSLRFYKKVLGLRIIKQWNNPLQALIGNHRVLIRLVETSDAPDPSHSSLQLLIWTSPFIFPTVLQRLQKAGVGFVEKSKDDDKEQWVSFKDPNGSLLVLKSL